ncbi:MAG: pyridoxamine 5'-phosphate oxidase family protein [Prevotellaceae bacterium]|jgi:general stress protein 26|nr:pyridoxamine 5'-phosphate oxidase family protein [Prevotellaceae bacterium]
MKIPCETLEKFIDRQSVAFISSIDADGFPNARAMLAPVWREGLKTFYWHTNTSSQKVTQFLKNPKCCVYFCDEQHFRGLMLRGTMEIITDEALRRRFWKDDYTLYYQGGLDGGDYTLMRFTARCARYYCDFLTQKVEIGD